VKERGSLVFASSGERGGKRELIPNYTEGGISKNEGVGIKSRFLCAVISEGGLRKDPGGGFKSNKT